MVYSSPYTYVIVWLTYHIWNESCSLYASRLDALEEIDYSLSFQSLQLGMDADECTSTTNAIAVIVRESFRERERERAIFMVVYIYDVCA